MGYELEIIRKSDYNDFDEESYITLQEWLDYVSTDNELKLTNGYFVPYSSGETWQTSSGFCLWITAPLEDNSGYPWLSFGNGSISAKNPDNELIRKMVQIANKLNAKVFGDSYEEYDDDYFKTGKPKFSDD